MKLRTAFTLIELLVVIAIIGILSGLIVVTMGGVTSKANIAKSQVFSNSLRNSLMLNLVSEWKLDEGTGTSAVDSWGGGNNCTWNGSSNGTYTTSPGWKSSSECISSNCLALDGTDDNLDCGSGNNLMPTSGFTIEAWINIPSGLSFPDGERVIASKSTSWDTTYDGYQFFYDATNISGRVVIKGEVTYLPTCAFETDKWHDALLVFDGKNKKVMLYVDGTLKDTKTTVATQFGGTWLSSNFYIGRYAITANRYFSGKIDGVRFYNAPVPASQIKEQYYAGLNKLLINGNISEEEYVGAIR